MTTTAPRYCTPADVAHLFGTSDAPHTIPAAEPEPARYEVGAAVVVRDSGNAYTVTGQQVATTGRGGMVGATRNADGRAMIFYPGELRPSVRHLTLTGPNAGSPACTLEALGLPVWGSNPLPAGDTGVHYAYAREDQRDGTAPGMCAVCVVTFAGAVSA